MREFSVQQSDDSLRETFFRSITLMVSVSSIILCGCEGSLFPAGITPLIAVVSWVIVDNKQWIRIPIVVGNILSLIALFAASSEFSGGTLERKLLSGAHLIVYLTWVVLLLPKGTRQFWWLIALSVLQIAVSGILSSGVGFGFAMVGMMLLLLWTMSVFSLFRVQSSHAMSVSGNGSFSEMSSVSRRRSVREFFEEFFGLQSISKASTSTGSVRGHGDALVRDGLQRDPSELWVGFRFRSMVAGSYFVSLVLAIIVFAAFPRVWIPGTSLWSSGEHDPGGQNRTGLSESVELGDIGTIMASNERVLAFEIRNLKSGRRANVEEYCNAMQMDEVRFRGNAFACYKEGRWTQGFVEHGFSAEGFVRPGNMIQRPAEYQLEVVQDPPFTSFILAPRPVTQVRGKGTGRISEGQISEILILSQGNRGSSERTPRVFTIENCLPVDNIFLTPEKQTEFLARSNEQLQQEVDELLSSRAEFYSAFYTMNGSFRARNQQITLGERWRWSYSPTNDAKELYPQIWNLARNLCMENGGLVPPQERVDRVLKFLSPENGFQYSLTQQRNDRSLDPLVDFILNTKTGHCEYFASACTLMLQCAEVPSRLINGYYGSEENGLTGKYEVRQRHAHAWVESYVNNQWITLEPTPSAQRQAEVKQSSNKSIISDLRHALSDFWNDGIQQMSAERQQEFFAPVISTSKSLLDTIREQGLWTTFKTAATQFVRNPQSWISWQGGVVTFLLLLIIGGLVRLNVFDRLWKFLQRWRPSGRHNSSTRSAIRFYEGFCSVCERQGLQFAPSNSAMENAKLATTELSWKLSSDELRQVPQRIANAFNAVRYGHQSLTEEQVASIGNDLNAFAEALKNPQTT